MLIGKCVGAVLLVGSAMGLASRYRTKTAALLSLLTAWREYLAQMQHAVRSRGVQLSELVRQALHTQSLRRLLPPDAAVFVPQGATASEQLEQLCRTAAKALPRDHDAHTALCEFAQKAAEAISPQQLCDQIDELDEALASLAQTVQATLQQSCRAATVLLLCGALCAVLLLW